MKGIFSNANFGDKFITRDGQCAVLLEKMNDSNIAMMWVENVGEQYYYADGANEECDEFDIVGKWEGGKE